MSDPLEITITPNPPKGVRDFEITLPDGRTVAVSAPDRDAAMTAAKNFMMREKGEARGKSGGIDNFGRSLARGASLGFADELAAAGDATFGPLVDKFTKSGTSAAPNWSERYTQNLQAERAQDRAYDDTSPVASTTGKVVGGVGGAVAALPSWLLAAPTIARGAAGGAALGAASGFGEGEGGLVSRLESAGKGGVAGGAVGAAAVPAGRVAGTVGSAIAESGPGRWVADKVIGPGMRYVADKLDSVAPQMRPKSLSAAAPEGGQLPVSGPLTDTADYLRTAAPTGDRILEDAAARRIADAAQRGGEIPQMGPRLTELGQDAMLVDAGNPMVTRLGRTAYISPGSAPKIIDEAMTTRNRGIGDRMTGSIDAAMGDSSPAVLEAQRLNLQRGNQGRIDYAEAVGPDAPYTISPQMREVMQSTPSIRKAMDTILDNAAQNGVTLTPAQVAHRVKQQLASDADAAFASGRAVNKDDVRTAAERWRTALHEANPAIRAADEAWQASSATMDALDLGRQFMRQGTGETADAVSPAILAQRIPHMSADEARAFIAGAADTMKMQAGAGQRQARALAGQLDENGSLRAKLETMIGPDNARILFNRAMSERTFAGTDKAIRGGSDTAGKLLSAMDDAASGQIPTSPHSLVSRLLSGAADAYNKSKAGNEAVRGRIAKMLTETDANVNAETLDRIARILAEQNGRSRAIQRGASSAIGGAGSRE